ncbi:MAG: M20/M25/M40 family metallo-hydrolase [Ignavibacteria bacterium]|nr:M20/M25/M40 family metallo-hydrolase [Ignavibacteria bacterium]
MRVPTALILTILLSPFALWTQETAPEISATDLQTHIRFLASDRLEGRRSGTDGNREAARYIADMFDRLGLTPLGDDGTYFQEFSFTSGVELGPENELAFMDGERRIGLLPDVDFRPFGFSTSGQTTGEVVFAGYGISAPDQGYDDYADLDVEGKVVVALRYSPEGDNPHSDFGRHATFRSKARIAREMGAAALIIITGPKDDPDDELVPLGFDQSSAGSGIPVISMRHGAFDQLLIHSGRTTAGLQDSIDSSGRPVGMALTGVTATIGTDVKILRSTTANIVGYLQGDENQDEAEVLVIGAHMDHLGFGGPGSGSLDPHADAIHNGADDNASGTAGLLELAEFYAKSGGKPNRGIVCVAFSAEELGTLGSAYYVENPPIPLERTVAMINMDMIGRLEDSVLTIYGTGSSPAWESLITEKNRGIFKVTSVADGVGPSDHTQFYGKEIPVLFFFTGTHDDYHKPSDDWEKINYEGETDILSMIRGIADEILQNPEKPGFTRVASGSTGPGGESGRTTFRVTLGVVPDYAFEGTGMKIGGVRPGGPAELAGLTGGDVIVGMAGKEILNIYDYMAILGNLRIGDEVEVVVSREGSEVRLQATMTKSN